MAKGRRAAAALAVAAALGSCLGAAAAQVTLKGMDAAKVLFQNGDYEKSKFAAGTVAFDDIWQPEALYHIGLCLEKLSDREQAAAFYHLTLRVLDEGPKLKNDPRTPTRKAMCQRALKALDKDFLAAQKQYADAAQGKKFPSPDKVDDLWTTQVKATLHPLHGLYAWKLFGGRKDLKPDWIHNAQGVMHRSGAKCMDDINGRHGVLFCIPNKKSRLRSTLTWEGPAKGKILRIGAMAYNFPYLLNALIGDKQIFSKTIGKDAWDDLKIPLEAAPSQEAPLVLELVVPEDQRWAEGAFFDYIDFFED